MNSRVRFYLILFMVVVCVDIALYVGFMGDSQTAYLHFFYFPILFAALWFRTKAVYAGFFLSAIYFFVSVYSFNIDFTPFMLTQAIVLILVSYVAGAISEKQAEAEAELEKEQTFSENVINTVPDSLLVIGRDLRLKRANRTFYDIFKTTPDDVIGLSIGEILHDDEGTFSTELKKAFITHGGMDNFEKYYQSEVMGERVFSARARPIIDTDEEENLLMVKDVTKQKFLENGLVVFEDITERKLSEKRLDTYREHLKLINRILRHDLLNDLTVIGSAINLYKNTSDVALLEEASGRVMKSSDLIRKMKELESLISSSSGLKMLNVSDVFEKAMGHYKSTGFHIDGSCQILADESFESVLENIINNAVIHGKTDKIDVMLEEKEDVCEIKIADYGVGIPDEIKDKIFQEDFKYGKTGKTGLGLYIVRKAVERYGGSVEVEDNLPTGCIFTLKLKKKA
jgi:PAS domain S-box-containing protein